MDTTEHVIAGRPSLGPVVVAASLALLAMVLLVAGGVLDWGVIPGVVALLLAAAAVVLILGARSAAKRAGLVITMQPDGYAITGNGTDVQGQWKDVQRVGLAGNRLTLHQTDGRQVAIAAPPGATPNELDAVAAELARRLDVAHGYGRGLAS